MTVAVDDSARIVESSIGRAEIREYVTIHDSEIGDGCRIYERSSLKKCRVGEDVDINAGTYIENAEIGANVQVGPNCSIVGVTHEMGEQGMAFRGDVFERIVLDDRVFIGASAILTPGIEIGERTVVAAGAIVTHNIDSEQIVLGIPPSQRIVDLREWVNR